MKRAGTRLAHTHGSETDGYNSALRTQPRRDAARQSLILLKNDAQRGLPFEAGRRLVVVGNDFDDVLGRTGAYRRFASQPLRRSTAPPPALRWH